MFVQTSKILHSALHKKPLDLRVSLTLQTKVHCYCFTVTI